MNCFACAGEISESFFAEWARTSESRYGVFRCPHCQSTHIRRVAGHRSDGQPIHEFRLWGHPVTTRRFQRSGGLAGTRSR